MVDNLDNYNLATLLDEEQMQSVNIGTLIVIVLLIIAMWKIFTKAGQGGWKALIPFYNVYTLCKIADGCGWKFLLLIIPIVNFIYYIILNHRMAKSFGKGILFTLGLIFFPNLFTLILGFGKAQYIGPKGQSR